MSLSLYKVIQRGGRGDAYYQYSKTLEFTDSSTPLNKVTVSVQDVAGH